MVQFLAETCVVVLVSTVAGVLLAWLSLPLMNALFDIPADASVYLQPDLGLALLGLLVVLTFLAGLYPALVLSSFSPLAVFRRQVGRGWLAGISLRQVLIVAQFATAIVLLIGMIVNLRQMQFLSRLNLGFVKEGVYTFGMDTEYQQRYRAFRDELLRVPGVAAVSFSSDKPSSDNNWQGNFGFTDLSKDEDFQISLKMADGDYANTYGMTFLAGGAYLPTDTLMKFVVNETLLKKLGVRNPASVIGRKLRIGAQEPAPIVGVVRDFHTNSAREAIKPIVMLARPQYYWTGSVRLRSQNVTQTVAQLQKAYATIFPEVAFDGTFYDDSLKNYYRAEEQMGLLYRVFAGLTIFIACLGLFGLSAFMAEARTKEIGVRKVLGASVASIVSLLSTDFLKLVLIAIVIASPIAWFAMNRWLQDFAYKINIEWWVFALAGLLAVGIALLTVSFQSVKAALMNPVKSLRSE